MNSFSTKVELGPAPLRIGMRDGIIAIGSCFAQQMGQRLQRAKLNVLTNPFGIVFNPTSIATVLAYALEHRPLKDLTIVEHDGLFHSMQHHGRFSQPSEEQLMDGIQRELSEIKNYLRDARLVILTFGTAYAYRHKASDQIVANCHKIPSPAFQKQLLTVTEIVEEFNRVIGDLLKLRPDVSILCTVSPVRHWKDGAHHNQLSKSTLLLAVNELVNEFSACSYFPSYEILLDELRDYRFYAEDMLHPSDTAVDYIQQKFESLLLDGEAIEAVKKIRRIQRSLDHRPQHAGSSAHRAFVQQTQAHLHQLQVEFPWMDFSKEKGRLHQLTVSD
ncbi:MAG: GSCFA domain-containing protein [Saprospiraceae bacterium]|nr:GSCFA domain-containing protein [Saprospiraceae bacterium]